jgi:hypothetical protein
MFQLLFRVYWNGRDHLNAIRLTWGKRCAILVFLLGGMELDVIQLDERTSVVNLPIEDTYNTTWIKVKCKTCSELILVCRCVRV